MSLSGVRGAVTETWRLWDAAQREPEGVDAAILVSGMLAKQLARELGAGAAAGAVTVVEGWRPPAQGVVAHVLAGQPSADDETLVREADGAGVPVVLVQLWPQEDWGALFVLSPFVVECLPGAGFPIEEISRRIAEAAADPIALASRVPVLREVVAGSVVRGATLRAALLGATGDRRDATRPLITLEQVGMLSRLRAVTPGPPETDETPFLAGTAAAVYAASFVFRAAARSLGARLPAPIVEAGIAAAGTWALARIQLGIENRIARS